MTMAPTDELLCDENVSIMTPRREPVASRASRTQDTNADDYHAPDATIHVIEAFEMRLMREASDGYVRDANYLVDVQKHGMDATWRFKMCRWMFETAKAFDLTQDAVGCAIHFLDQYLSEHSVDKVLLQLLCMVCMYVASKMHETQPITLEEMELLCEHKFTKDQILSLEAKLVAALDWKLSPPVGFSFARDLMALINRAEWTGEHESTVLALLQAATEEYASLNYSSSVMGVAAVKLVAGSQMKSSLTAAVTKASAPFKLSRLELTECNAFLRKIYIAQFQPQELVQFADAVAEHPRIDSPTSVEEYFEPRHHKSSPSLQRLIAVVDAAAPQTQQEQQQQQRTESTKRTRLD